MIFQCQRRGNYDDDGFPAYSQGSSTLDFDTPEHLQRDLFFDRDELLPLARDTEGKQSNMTLPTLAATKDPNYDRRSVEIL